MHVDCRIGVLLDVYSCSGHDQLQANPHTGEDFCAKVTTKVFSGECG